MNGFRYHPDIFEKFPHVVGGITVMRNVVNGASSDELQALYIEEQQATLQRIGDTPLSQIESLAAWRRAFTNFGVDPTQYRSAAEALLRRLTKKGDIPSINTLVDIGNLVSIRYGLPVAVCDTRDVQGTITVRYADGSERFTELGAEAPVNPEVGEVIFADDTGMVMARRWCWRQSAESAAREDTTAIIVTIEAQHPKSKGRVEEAQGELIELLTTYGGGKGTIIAGVLDIWRPSMP
jgi:DNA/RNA-binding domain of Phe-tRNA-synthetase-like protein